MPKQTEPTTGPGGHQPPQNTTPEAQQQFVAAAQPVADALRAGGQENAAQSLEGAAQVIVNARKALDTTAANLKRIDEERDNFIRNAQPMAEALRKSGKPVEAKQLKEAARVIGQTKGMGPEQAGRVLQAAPAQEKTLKEIMDGVFAAIDKDPKLRAMPEANNLREASTALDKDGMLNIKVRNGVVVSFTSNFADNMIRTQKVAPAPADAKQTPAQVAAGPAVAAAPLTPAQVVAPVATPTQPAASVPTPTPASTFTAYPTYTNYAPSTENGIIDTRKTTQAPIPQMNIGITAKGEFGINPQVNQQRLIGDGISMLGKYFDFEMPTSGFKISHVGLAEPGQMKQTEKGWEVINKGKLALTDTAGNVFKPALEPYRNVEKVVEQAPTITQPVATAPVLSPTTPQKVQQSAQVTPFARAEMPDALLSKLGVQVSDLEKSGQLEKLLQGKKTDLIEGFSLTGLSGEPIPFAAKLVMHRDDQGVATLKIDLPKHGLIIPKEIMGKTITPAMQVELHKNGVLPLTPGFTDGHGQPFSAYLGVDKQMNRVVAVRQEAMARSIPKEVLGVELDPEISRQLLEGKATKLVGMTNSKQQVFDATVQLDPVKRQLTFREVQPHQVQQRRRGLSV